jgi:PhoH-like ATPase
MTAETKQSKLFLLDTNILMHDPTAIYHFDEHNVYLAMVVLEELDQHKTGLSEVARNVRQTNRMLVELMNNASHKKLSEGLPLFGALNPDTTRRTGRLFFQTDDVEQILPKSLPGHNVDNTLLGIALGLKKNTRNNKLLSSPKTSTYALKLEFSVFLPKIIITTKS